MSRDRDLADPPNEPLTVLRRAEDLITGPRRADYGPALDGFGQVGRVWGALLNLPGPVPPETVGLMMVGLKLCRETEKHKEDNLVDAAGYVGTVDQVHRERERERRGGIP